MRICFLAPADNYHTQKWCGWFVAQGHEVYVISLIKAEIKDVKVITFETGVNAENSDFKKIKYLFSTKKIKEELLKINPNVISVHYATSYGTIAALAGIKDYFLSVWGADVYDFPQKSVLHKIMLKYSLSKAKYILSTSQAMAEETKKYTDKEVFVTPFGVDMKLFNPNKREGEKEYFVVGTIKSLTPKYGIDYLLKAIAIIKEKHSEIPIQLRIAGKGSHEKEYKQLAKSLGIDDCVTWLGFIEQRQVAIEWANMDVAVIPSTVDSESFGVSAVEAEACGVPVIISDIPGLKEATLAGKSSIVIRRKDEIEIADAIVRLYKNPEIRKNMGIIGRKYVQNEFSIEKCFNRIEKMFLDFVNQNG